MTGGVVGTGKCGEKKIWSRPFGVGLLLFVRSVEQKYVGLSFFFLLFLYIYIYIDIYTERNVYLPLQFIYKAEKVLQKNELVIW